MSESRAVGLSTTVLMWVSALSALTMTGLVVRRELFMKPPQPPTAQKIIDTIPDWSQYAIDGHRMGPDTAPVTMVLFSDFECPYCGLFERGALKDIRAKYPQQVSVVYRHLIGPSHRFAYPAARAVECAAEQQRFEAYHDQLFATQDSLGLLTFEELARRSRIPDLERFRKCNASSDSLPTVTADRAAARKLGVAGTPTFLLNGVMVRGQVPSEMLDSLVRVTLQSGRKAP